ncbi:MAG: hypothetical protein GY732_15555 [Gammaproteobacteria bacterium]|nr:hypothetical protein [Gammaproteobacteria bacterium]
MEIKNFKQAMKLQKELSAKLNDRVKKLHSEKAPSVAATIKEQEKHIAQARMELTASEKGKKQVIKSWDQRIKQGKATVERLEKGLEEMKEKVKEHVKVTKK